MKKTKVNIEYEVGSGNVFADLGFPDAQERLTKVNLAYQINSLIKKKKLTQKKVAELLDIDQPKVSLLSQGKLSGFSLERLFRFLTILGHDITIQITPKKSSKRPAGVRVVVPKRSRKPIINRSEDSQARIIHAKKRR